MSTIEVLNEAQKFELADALQTLMTHHALSREEAERRMRLAGFTKREIQEVMGEKR